MKFLGMSKSKERGSRHSKCYVVGSLLNIFGSLIAFVTWRYRGFESGTLPVALFIFCLVTILVRMKARWQLVCAVIALALNLACLVWAGLYLDDSIKGIVYTGHTDPIVETALFGTILLLWLGGLGLYMATVIAAGVRLFYKPKQSKNVTTPAATQPTPPTSRVQVVNMQAPQPQQQPPVVVPVVYAPYPVPPPGHAMPPPGHAMGPPGHAMGPPGHMMPPPGHGMPPPGHGMPPPGQGMPAPPGFTMAPPGHPAPGRPVQFAPNQQYPA